jgi:hypothetical protein
MITVGSPRRTRACPPEYESCAEAPGGGGSGGGAGGGGGQGTGTAGQAELEAALAIYLENAREAFGGWLGSDDSDTVMQAIADRMARNLVTGGSAIAQNALDTPSCAGLFNLPAGVTAWDVLQSKVTMTYVPEDDWHTFASTTYGANGSVTINFNTDIGSNFVTSDASSAADTMIHELIHAVYGLYGANAVAGAIAQGWVNDDGSGSAAQQAAAETANFAVVKNNCFK